jgi:retron-type reverse transcriptase
MGPGSAAASHLAAIRPGSWQLVRVVLSPWVLQIDSRLYFPSIDHQILMAQLRQMITCPGTQWLLVLLVAADGLSVRALPYPLVASTQPDL